MSEQNLKELDLEKTSLILDTVTILPSVTEEEKELAASAYDEFQAENYDSCKTILNKLQTLRPKDQKVIHNKAISEYYASDLVKTDLFRKRMKDVFKQAHMSIDKIDALDDVNHCVMFFNQAVILFHLHQYHAAIAIVDKLFQFIEPIDEHLARKVCFLLLELYLCTHQPEKALGLVSYVENMLFGSGNKRDSSDGKTPTPEKDTKDKERENSKEKEISDFNPNEHYRPKLQHYKARCYIMLKSTKACKREIKSLMNSGGSLPAIFLRSQLEYLRGNQKKSLKVLNTAFLNSAGPPFKTTGDNLACMYYNNVGCIHFYMGKPNLGSFYFVKAIQEHENGIKAISQEGTDSLMSRPLHTLDITVRYQILYNLGLQYLHSCKPQAAFDCLIEAIQVYHRNPRLWLRLAECCILAHKSDNDKEMNLRDRKKYIVQKTVGSGAHRKILLAPHLSNHNKGIQSQTPAMPTVSLEFANLCLTNALLLLPEEHTSQQSPQTSQTSAAEGDTETQASETNLLLPAPPANSLQKSEVTSLRNSILIASSYVCLCLGDIMMALKHAETLLMQQRYSGAQGFLAHLYAAEALVLLDRIGDAIKHLNPELVKEIGLAMPPEEPKPNNDRAEEGSRSGGFARAWYPSSVSTAKVIFLYNLAVAYTLRGELDKASETLKQVGSSKGAGTDIPAQAVMLAIYIQLHQGHTDLAKAIIKQHLPQYR